MPEDETPQLPWKPAPTRAVSDADIRTAALQSMQKDRWSLAATSTLARVLALNEEAWATYLDVEEYRPEEMRRFQLVCDLLLPTGLVPILGALARYRDVLTEPVDPTDPHPDAAVDAALDTLEKALPALAAFLGMR